MRLSELSVQMVQEIHSVSYAIWAEKPDSGTITLGDTAVLSSVDQFRDTMDDKKTVWEEISNGQDIYVSVILKFRAVLMWGVLILKV